MLRGGRRFGHNTGGSGFAESFRRGLPDVAMKRVVQLGAGGAGCAVAHAALTLGVEQLAIFDVEPDRSRRLAADLVTRFGEGKAVADVKLDAAMGVADGSVPTLQ